MLATKSAIATVAVKDLPAARKFYEQTLGLTVVHEEGKEAISFKTGGSSLLVYRSQFAGTNRATSVTWDLGRDVTSAVETLKKKGVKFEHYDLPGMKLEGDVHVAPNMRVAWFKDPEGNIHSLIGV